MKITRGFKVRQFVLAVVLSTGLSVGLPAFGQNTYIVDSKSGEFIQLGALGESGAVGQAINDSGQVAGYSDTAQGKTHAFITGPNGVGMSDLGTLEGDFSIAYGINAAGQVVGAAHTSIGNQYGFITGPNGAGMTNLGTLGTDDLAFSVAYAVNAAGRVVGATSADLVGGGTTHAFITGPNGANMTDLGTLGKSTDPRFADASDAQAINDAGQVAGESTIGGHYHAFITGINGVGMTDLGTLGGSTSFALDINAAGQVVGGSNLMAEDSFHAFITGPNGEGMTDLGTLGGETSSANGINATGQVVGHSLTTDGSQHAFITGPNGEGMTDLNSLVNLPAGVVLTDALAINNLGQIVAIAAVPEPATYALMLAGLGLIGFMARQQRAL